LLVAYEKALAAGTADAPAAELSPDLQPELAGAQACIQLLHQFLPRPNLAAPAGEAPALPFARLGRFQILHELGRGGFGMVFLASDPQLGRVVALKVPRPEALLTPELRERFLREARAAAGLDHPNVVPVHEAGQEGLICYIASAYCPGVTLAEWLKERTEPVPVRLAARLVATLAEAVQHAHSRGVVHRDLKPANVLLQLLPEARTASPDSTLKGLDTRRDPSDAELTFIPKVTDFGLAKLAVDMQGKTDGKREDPTQSGAVLGTPQ
jgi:serine/threonine protein kinase